MFGLTKAKTPDMKIEMQRRKSRRMELLEAFKKNKMLTTRDLWKFGPGVSSRIYELRKDGHRIGAVYEKPGLYSYVYRGKQR